MSQGLSSRSQRGRISAEGVEWWERERRFQFGSMMGRCEMLELRRALIDEVETILKEFVVKLSLIHI